MSLSTILYFLYPQQGIIKLPSSLQHPEGNFRYSIKYKNYQRNDTAYVIGKISP